MLTELSQRMKMELELRGYSPRTVRSYLLHVRYFAKYFNTSPDKLNINHIKQYLHQLIISEKYSDSYISCSYFSLKFFYSYVVDFNFNFGDVIPYFKPKKTVPVVLSKSEINTLLNSVTNIKHRAILTVIYSSGLRLGEACRLQISDIDSKNMQIFVRQGKGKKDRYTILSQQCLILLRQYYKLYKPVYYLFEGLSRDKHIAERTVEKVFTKAYAKTNINKKACVHTLRHSFATHFIESGGQLCHLQELLGHSSIQTTSKYIHLQNLYSIGVRSPLDLEECEKNV